MKPIGDSGDAPRNLTIETRRAFAEYDLENYSLRDRLLIGAAGLAASLFVRLAGSTVRFKVEGREHLDSLRAEGHAPIFVVWHNRALLGAYYLRDLHVVVLTSRSFDGECIARFLQRLGLGAVRGSSSRGGASALIQMVRYARQGIITGITPDGPRGPKYEIKPGTVVLAKKSGQPMLPINVTAKRHWKMRSWDGFQIPKPFSPALVRFGEPVWVPADADENELANKTAELKRSMTAVYASE